MLVIRPEQMQVFENARKDSFYSRLDSYLCSTERLMYQLIATNPSRLNFYRTAIDKANEFGFLNEDDIARFTTIMLWLGSSFYKDAQHEKIANVLSQTNFLVKSETDVSVTEADTLMFELYSLFLDDQQAYLSRCCTFWALLQGNASASQIYGSIQSTCPNEDIGLLAVRHKQLCEQYQFASPEQQNYILCCMGILGTEFLTDPRFVWESEDTSDKSRFDSPEQFFYYLKSEIQKFEAVFSGEQLDG